MVGLVLYMEGYEYETERERERERGISYANERVNAVPISHRIHHLAIRKINYCSK
jgi:hypothetical protein